MPGSEDSADEVRDAAAYPVASQMRNAPQSVGPSYTTLPCWVTTQRWPNLQPQSIDVCRAASPT